MININDYLTLIDEAKDTPIGVVPQYAVEADVLYPDLIERILELKTYTPEGGRWYPHIDELVMPDDLEGTVESFKQHFARMRDIAADAFEDGLNLTCHDLMEDFERMQRRAEALDCVRLFMTRMFKIRHPNCSIKILAGIPDKWRHYPKFE